MKSRNSYCLECAVSNATITASVVVFLVTAIFVVFLCLYIKRRLPDN